MATIRVTCPLASAPSPGVLYETRAGEGIVHSVEALDGDLAAVTVEIPAERAEPGGRGPGTSRRR